MIDVQTAKDGIAYLDSELESGYPVLVGVDYEFDRKIKLKNGKICYPNKTDYTTDHYIVMIKINQFQLRAQRFLLYVEYYLILVVLIPYRLYQ